MMTDIYVYNGNVMIKICKGVKMMCIMYIRLGSVPALRSGWGRVSYDYAFSAGNKL